MPTNSLFQPIPKNLQAADLLLINPDFSKNELGTASAPDNPLGLNRIASALRQNGRTCQILDTTGREASRTGPEELGDWLNENADRYRMIGFHVNSWNLNHLIRILSRARGILKKKKLLFGGPLPNSEPKRTLELFGQQGLGDLGLVQGLGEKITDEILGRDRFAGVDGLWAIEDGRWQEGHKVTLAQSEFEKLPFLSLEHHTFYQNYYKPSLESGDLGPNGLDLIFAAQGLDVNRGCPFQCTYCSVPQYEERMVMFSPKRVTDELEHLAKEAGFFMFTFTNSNILFLEADWIREFCRELIGRGMHQYLNWTAYHHPIQLANLEVADFNLMRKSGSDTVVFGIQSFEEDILRKFLRPINTPALTRIIREKTRHAKQDMAVDYITGVPYEDLDVIEQAFRYFAENDIECRNYQLKIYPNTRLPRMGFDFSRHDLVPITGSVALELSAMAVVPKDPNPRSAKLDAFMRESNMKLIRKRPARLGPYTFRTAEEARTLLEKTIPENSDIPDKVKQAMTLALREMLNPKRREHHAQGPNPAELMRAVVMAGPDAPPMVLATQAKLRREMGEEKFLKLKEQFTKGH